MQQLALVYFWQRQPDIRNCRVRAAGEETDSSTGTVQNPVVLNYWIWDDEEYYISKIVDAFEMTHPGIEIELHIMENYIYDDKIKDVVKSEEPVDLLGIRGVTKIVDYQEEGLLLELNELSCQKPARYNGLRKHVWHICD